MSSAKAYAACLGLAAAVGCSGGGGAAPSTAVAGPAASAPEGLYGIDPAAGVLLHIDPATAAATVVGPMGLTVANAGADFDCEGKLWAFSSVGGQQMDLYTLDLGSGAATVVKSFAVPGLATGSGFEFGPDEVTPFWRNGPSLFTLDAATGTVHLVGTAGQGDSLSMPPSCDQFLGGSCSGEECALVRIDPATAALTFVGPTAGLGFSSLASTPDGRLFGVSSGSLYRLDPATGAPTLVGRIMAGQTAFAPEGMAYGPHGVCCQALDCSGAAPTVATLWPPNHRLVEVGVQGVTGPGGAPATVTITGVTQDEPVNGLGDGNTAPDAVLDGATAGLRAERSGLGDGRVYHLAFTASAAARSCQGTVTVCVPHDQGRGSTCVDQGPLFDSTVP